MYVYRCIYCRSNYIIVRSAHNSHWGESPDATGLKLGSHNQMLKKLIDLNQQELGNGVLRVETPMKNKGSLLVFSEIEIYLFLDVDNLLVPGFA